MITRFSELSISGKLRRAIIFSTGGALFLAAIVLTTLQVLYDREDLIGRIAVLADAVASSTTAALEFSDEETAERLLGALSAEEQVSYALLLDRERQPVATYQQSTTDLSKIDFPLDIFEQKQDELTASRFSIGELQYLKDVTQDERVLGYLYISTDLSRSYEMLFGRLGSFVAILFLAGFLAVLLSDVLRRRIAEPIARLALAMDDVGVHQNYSLRVDPGEGDETGRLIRGFNGMLSEIQARNEELFSQRDQLEDTVQARTAELSQANSDLRVAIEESDRARDEAESANRAKTQFLATISHEIRTPMNGMLGMAELLTRTELDTRQQHFAEVIQRSGGTLLSIINDVLDFSKIDVERLELRYEPVDLRVLLEDSLELFAARAREKNLALELVVSSSLPAAVRADRVRLRQVIDNLLSNAIKFTEQGEVRLELQVLAEGADGFDVRFDVSDTGIGIAKEKLLSVFEPFSQVDSTPTRKAGGTGLGLAISSRLVRLMGGELTLESKITSGSVFSFCLHFARSEPIPSVPGYQSVLAGFRVLIVDDSVDNRAILHQQVLEWGMVAEMAADASDAFAKVQLANSSGRPYQLLLLDGQMPEADGSELASRLACDSDNRQLKIIILSSAALDFEELQAENPLLDAVLEKPVPMDELRREVSRILAGVRPADLAMAQVDTTQKFFGTRVLVVEDNLVNQEVARNVLELFGCQVTVVNNGREAIDAQFANPFDIILMDFHMPVLDGISAVRVIREAERSKGSTEVRTPVIALTADAQRGIESEALAAGMDAFLSKPFGQAELATLLAELLPRELVSEQASAVREHAQGSEQFLPSDKEAQAKEIDESILNNLRSLDRVGEAKVSNRILLAYLDESPISIASMGRAWVDGDREGICEAAHSLKSSSANVGATHFSELCARLESISISDTDLSIGELIETVEQRYPGVRREISQLVSIEEAAAN
ncbi:MAG: response regulator [Pseudomonadota bacterium]